MRLAPSLSLASLVLVAGCSASEDAASGTADLTGTIRPKQGLYTGTTVSYEDTCGLGPWLDRAYVVSGDDGYATSYVVPESNFQFSYPLTLAGKTAKNESTQTIELAGGTRISVVMKMVDTWQSASTFVRRAEESFLCEGSRCESAPRTLGMSGELPCSATKITAYALASCDEYPFRQVYDPGITSVWISGTFNDWARTPAEGALVMKQDGEGVWTLDAKLPPPASGQHLYKFIKNGRAYWDQDAANPVSVEDGRTGKNSVLYCQ